MVRQGSPTNCYVTDFVTDYKKTFRPVASPKKAKEYDLHLDSKPVNLDYIGKIKD